MEADFPAEALGAFLNNCQAHASAFITAIYKPPLERLKQTRLDFRRDANAVILNEQFDVEGTIKFDDLKNGEDEATGTLVTVKIPIDN